MTILSGDIKLLASDTMTDAAEGGGAITGAVIVDNVSNNIFDDISTLDRVYGAVHMRKVFGAIQTQNIDKYFGSHVIVSKLPGDTKIGVNLFNTGDWYDRRDSAKSRVEAYLSKGPEIQIFLFGTQYQGSRLLSMFSSASSKIKSSDVFILDDGVNLQYCRASNVDVGYQYFIDASGNFVRYVYSIEITSPLLYDYLGNEITRLDTVSKPTKIYSSVLSNAAKYYSARPLSVLAASGDVSITVDTIYTQLIPASQSETALINKAAQEVAPSVNVAANVTYSFVDGNSYAANSLLYLGRGCVPGTLNITIGAITLTDLAGKVKSGATQVGTIDYLSGVITFAGTSPVYSGVKTVTFLPGANPDKTSISDGLLVTSGNRGYTWVVTTPYKPQRGSVSISYKALGKWYTLQDDYAGGLISGFDGVGSGSVVYDTGTISLTTEALPDVNSIIVFTYTQNIGENIKSLASGARFGFNLTLENYIQDLSTISLAWNDGTARTSVCDTNGVLSGDATGYFDKGSRLLTVYPIYLFANTINIQVSYSGTPYNTSHSGSYAMDLGYTGETDINIDLGLVNVNPKSVRLYYQVIAPATETEQAGVTTYIKAAFEYMNIYDDGIGGLYVKTNQGSNILIPGSVNYQTGIVTLALNQQNIFLCEVTQYSIVDGKRNYSFYGYKYVERSCQVDPSQMPTVFYVCSSTQVQAFSETKSWTHYQLTMNSTDEASPSVPGSLLLTLGDYIYYDDNGTLKYNIDHTTGNGNNGGTIDYQSNELTITAWENGAANTPVLAALLSENGFSPTYNSAFVTSQLPLKSANFSVGFNLLDTDEHINVTAAINGTISNAYVYGIVDFNSGLVKLTFNSQIKAETLVYNGVAYQYIPLSSEILGINPVRLPPDGRVPVYQTGDVAVVLHDQTTTGTYTSSSTTDLGRGRIAKLTIRDLGGNPLAVDKYSADLDTGIITWGDLTGVSQPLTIIDRIEDMAVISDVQITGQLALSTPLTHNYPADETLVSNAMVYGTLYAHVSIPFDQQTWTNVWSDTLIGSSTAAQYNQSQYPIVVDNLSCIQERWAIIFTSATVFNLIGEHVGQIITGGTTATPLTPINPNTSLPYFTLPNEGWGAGWSTGNVLRFNTIAANTPCWIIQAIGQGEATSTDYTMCLEFRGDIDTP